METEVRHNAERSRYELWADAELAGIADYDTAGTTVMVFPHTEISPAMRGQGLAAVLVRAALDDVRAAGHTVDPQCWYVAQFIDQHPEYQDLLAA
jgi:predicted GNAT family acetyltransferase